MEDFESNYWISGPCAARQIVQVLHRQSIQYRYCQGMVVASVKLGVNIDHAATLRQARYRDLDRTCGEMVEPDPLLVALLAERAGADGITVHLREDRRHIQEPDVCRIREAIHVPLNLEMACTSEMMHFALGLRPHAVCLVPENREEITTEGGLNLLAHERRVEEVVVAMNKTGIQTSLFIDPEPDQIELAADLGAPVVELHTGSFANAYFGPDRGKELARLVEGALLAHECGLVVNAGHGINYHNIRDIMTIPHLHELNIGHSIISRALLTGIEEAVSTMKRRLQGGF